MDHFGILVFLFPSNGNAHRKLPVKSFWKTLKEPCFHSLQTGTRIAKKWRYPYRQPTGGWVSIPFKRERGDKEERHPYSQVQGDDGLFPFPSNGKVHRKLLKFFHRANEIRSCFHSLQTGNRSARLSSFSVIRVAVPQCFHSLQTGNRIASYDCVFGGGDSCRVSIPFKRESLSQDSQLWVTCLLRFRICFNSLQTGKPIQSDVSNAQAFLKSLQGFHSLQTGKRIQRPLVRLIRLKPLVRLSFNSLQTGKPIQRRLLGICWKRCSRSFNSLQTGKPIQRLQREKDQGAKERCFHSLQTGKRIQRLALRALYADQDEFPFPSNGKAYPKRLCTGCMDSVTQTVSIPFKRESLSKALTLVSASWRSLVSIPFKRESLSKVTRVKKWSRLPLVSIPFKRESLSKVCRCRK